MALTHSGIEGFGRFDDRRTEGIRVGFQDDTLRLEFQCFGGTLHIIDIARCSEYTSEAIASKQDVPLHDGYYLQCTEYEDGELYFRLDHMDRTAFWCEVRGLRWAA